MAISADYLTQLKALLPRGLVWVDSAQNKMGQLLAAMADELARVDARSKNLLDETDPRTVYELLPDWEMAFGLPDPCLTQAGTLDQRRKILHAKVTNTGGQSRQFFIELAAILGYDISITEFRPFTVISSISDVLTDDNWPFYWQVNWSGLWQRTMTDFTVNSPVTTVLSWWVFPSVRHFSVISDADAALAEWNEETLECAINRLKPAHTHVLFNYGEQ